MTPSEIAKSYDQLADKWKADGKQLYVASEFRDTIRQYFPRARVQMGVQEGGANGGAIDGSRRVEAVSLTQRKCWVAAI